VFRVHHVRDSRHALEMVGAIQAERPPRRTVRGLA
jgi:dihydropteroate synthase